MLTVRRKLMIVSLLPMGLAVVVGIVAWSAFQQLDANQRRTGAFVSLFTGYFDLGRVSHEYLHRPSPQSEQAWYQQHAEVAGILERLTLPGEDLSSTLERVRKEHAHLAEVFRQVEESGAGGTAAPGPLVDQWLGLMGQQVARLASMRRLIRTQEVTLLHRNGWLIIVSVGGDGHTHRAGDLSCQPQHQQAGPPPGGDGRGNLPGRPVSPSGRAGPE